MPGDPDYPQITALNLASSSIQNDKSFVRTAIEKNPFCFCGASEELRSDPEIVLLAAGAEPLLLESFEGYGESFDWPVPQSVVARGKLHSWVLKQLTAHSNFANVVLTGTWTTDGVAAPLGQGRSSQGASKQEAGDTAATSELIARIKELEATVERMRCARDRALRTAWPGKALAQVLQPDECLLPCLGGPEMCGVRKIIAEFAGVPSGRRLRLLRSLSKNLFRLDKEHPGWMDEERVSEPPAAGIGDLLRNSSFLSCMAGRILGSPTPLPDAPKRSSSFTKIVDADLKDPPAYCREPVTVAVAQPEQQQPQKTSSR